MKQLFFGSIFSCIIFFLGISVYAETGDTTSFGNETLIQQEMRKNYFMKIKYNSPVDRETLEYLTGSFTKDKNTAFFEGKIILESNVTTFVPVLIKNEWQSRLSTSVSDFSQDNKFFFYKDMKIGPRSLFGIAISKNCIIKQKVKLICYYNNRNIEQELVTDINGDIEMVLSDINGIYFKDKKYMYFLSSFKLQILSERIEDIKLLGDIYISDGQQIFYDGKAMSGIDITTFQVLGPDYTKDAENVYFSNTRIVGVNLDRTDYEGADPKTFEILEYEYSKDIKNVYFLARSIEGADPKTFQVLDSEYSKDITNVYFLGRPIEGADPKTFIVDNSKDAPKRAYDANNTYIQSRAESATDRLTGKDALTPLQKTIRDSLDIILGNGIGEIYYSYSWETKVKAFFIFNLILILVFFFLSLKIAKSIFSEKHKLLRFISILPIFIVLCIGFVLCLTLIVFITISIRLGIS